MATDASTSSTIAGREIAGRYRLNHPRASGGMARVWVADDLVLGRKVAVKILHPHLAADAEFVRRFRAEAKAAARLSHPGIVAIYDTASEPDLEAIVMELIEGMSLRQFFDSHGTCSLADTVDVVSGVAEALEVAHQAGIIHRDIKPGNIMLCAERRVKVADFGIAKALGTDDTATGALLGTAKYLAPEQVEGAAVDPRTDVYCLAIVAYECICGRPPFDEGNDSATALARVRRDPPPLAAFGAAVPRPVEDVLRRALARNPALRPPSIGAFAQQLRRAVGSEHGDSDATTVGYRPPPAADRRPVAAAATAAPSQLVEPERDGLRWVAPAAFLVVLLAIAGLGIALIAGTSSGRDLVDRLRDRIGTAAAGDPDTAPGPDGPAILLSDFDPEGDNREHPELLDRLADGDDTTVWQTERYDNRLFGNLKSGVGIVLDLADRRDLDTLTLVSPTDGWAAEVYVAADPAPTLAAWGEPVDRHSDIEPTVTTFSLGGRNAGAVLLWITDLGNGAVSRVDIGELRLN